MNGDFANTYFGSFLNNINFDFSIDFLLLGAPSTLPESLAFILNIEIIMLNFFLFSARNKKQLPLARNLDSFISWHRTLFIRNKNYAEKFNRILFDPG